MRKFFFLNRLSTSITILGLVIVASILSFEISSVRRMPLQKPSKTVWAAFDGGGSRSGINNFETAITASDVSGLTLLWQKALPYKTNGTPAEIPTITTSSGVKDLLFITTQKGSLVALDAATGVKIWQTDTNGNFVAGQGTSSSPAVDPSNQFVYSYGMDGKVHKYAVATGSEDLTKGFPVTVTKSTDVEKISSPLNVGNGYLYTVTSGYGGDFGQYVGHLVAVNLASGTTTIFNSLCSNIKQLSPAGFCPQKGSGIWSRAGASIDPVTNNVFVVTGNGNYNASTGGTNYGDSIVELTPDLSGIVDSYTPSNFSLLDSQDGDLGSTGVVLLPPQSNTNTPYLLVVGGKDNKVRLLNKQNLSGSGGPNHVGGELQTLPVSCNTFGHPIAWNDSTSTTWVFISDMCGNLYGYKVTNSGGNSTLQQVYQKSGVAKNSLFMANGVLFAPTGSNLSAVEPTTGIVLWSSSQSSAGGNIGTLHWQSPLVVNGGVYMPDDNGNITAYGLPNVTQPISPTPTPTSPARSTIFHSTVCPHGLGNCGDNVNPGSGGNIQPQHTNRDITVTILNASGQPVATGQGAVIYMRTSQDFQGDITIVNLSNGQYLASVKMDGFLPKQISGIITVSPGQTISPSSVSLVSGNINNDNQLDILDYNILTSCFGSKQSTPSCLQPPTVQTSGADINDDGQVDGIDYNLFIRELSVQRGG